MNFQIRKHKILEILNHQDSVEVSELAYKLGISEITIRRDLKVLAKEKLLERTHGGAVSVNLNKLRISFDQKTDVNSAAKEEIAEKAAAKIKNGDVVFLGCGSTVFRMCKYLKNIKIKVVTNSLPVLNELIGSEARINFVGGEVDDERKATHGKMAIEHIKRYSLNKAFLGIDGISLARGLSANTEKEAEITLAIGDTAEETYYLCDSSKIEVDKYFFFEGIEIVKNVISDSKIKKEYLDSYEKYGIRIL